jgi:hypothetical protein
MLPQPGFAIPYLNIECSGMERMMVCRTEQNPVVDWLAEFELLLVSFADK